MELELREDYEWRRTIRLVALAAPALRMVTDKVVMVATVLDIDADDVLTLRVGDGIVTVSTTGDPPLGLRGATIELTAAMSCIRMTCEPPDGRQAWMRGSTLAFDHRIR